MESLIHNENYVRAVKLKFKLLAAFYDLFDLVFIFDRSSNPRLAFAREIPNKPLSILDVCVGTANSSLIVAEANHRNEITGIDLSPDMLAVADRKIRNRGIRNLSLLQMDATNMDFSDEEFDIVMVSFGLHELGYSLMMNILREIYRVLMNQGKLYIVDYERQSAPVKSFIFSLYLKIFEPGHMKEFLNYDWTHVLESVGFQIMSIEKCLFSKLIRAAKT